MIKKSKHGILTLASLVFYMTKDHFGALLLGTA